MTKEEEKSVEREISEIFEEYGEKLKKEAKKPKMSLLPLQELLNTLKELQRKKKRNKKVLFHLFFMRYYINHIMNHIAGDSSYLVDDKLKKDIATCIAAGLTKYSELIVTDPYKGLIEMPLAYLEKIGYNRGEEHG